MARFAAADVSCFEGLSGRCEFHSFCLPLYTSDAVFSLVYCEAASFLSQTYYELYQTSVCALLSRLPQTLPACSRVILTSTSELGSPHNPTHRPRLKIEGLVVFDVF